MAKIPYDVNVVENISTLMQRAKAAINQSIITAANRSKFQLQRDIRTIIRQAIQDTDTYSSILRGKLRFELGIPDGRSKLAVIINTWVDSIIVDIKPLKSNPRLLLRVKGIRADYSDVLSLSEAQQLTLKGEHLEWLQWLLLEGSNLIISNYVLGFGRGRAGPNIMIEQAGGSWSVPQRFVGFPDDNFITRAIESAEGEIINTMKQHFVKQLATL